MPYSHIDTSLFSTLTPSAVAINSFCKEYKHHIAFYISHNIEDCVYSFSETYFINWFPKRNINLIQ